MRFLKHLVYLIRDFFNFAKGNRAWWLIPVILILLLLAGLIIVGQTAAPFIYTLF